MNHFKENKISNYIYFYNVRMIKLPLLNYPLKKFSLKLLYLDELKVSKE